MTLPRTECRARHEVSEVKGQVEWIIGSLNRVRPSWGPGVTAKKAPEGFHSAMDDTVALDSLLGIDRARWDESTRW